MSTTRAAPSTAGDGTTGASSTRRVWLVLVVGVVLTFAALPIDGMLTRWVLRSDGGLPGAARLVPRLGGDFKRELEFLQQFGAVSSLVLIGLVMLLLDRARVRRVADMALSAALVGLSCNVLKLTIGRPRPKFDDPHTFLFPQGQYQLMIQGEPVLRHAWEIGRGISSDLWSMPSSHTAAGVALAVFLCAAYPRLRPLAIGLAILVGIARILLGAHYLSDVLAGATLGYVVSQPIVQFQSGQGLLARLTGQRGGRRLNS